MEEKKYELTENKKEWFDRTLYQIRALKDFSDVKKGDLGGWIEKELNLSQEGDCWVYDEAMVFDNAMVYNNAKVYNRARVHHNAIVCDDAKVYNRARVYHNAIVCNDAIIYGNAKIYNEAIIYNDAKVYDFNVYGNTRIFDTVYKNSEDSYICISAIDSKKDYITAFLNQNKKIMIASADFIGSSIEDFKKEVEKEYDGNKYSKRYKRFLKYVEEYFKDILEEDNE